MLLWNWEHESALLIVTRHKHSRNKSYFDRVHYVLIDYVFDKMTTMWAVSSEHTFDYRCLLKRCIEMMIHANYKNGLKQHKTTSPSNASAQRQQNNRISKQNRTLNTHTTMTSGMRYPKIVIQNEKQPESSEEIHWTDQLSVAHCILTIISNGISF